MSHTETLHVSRIKAKQSLNMRRHDYDAKVAAIGRDEDPLFYPAEFVLYLLERQGITEEAYSVAMGNGPDNFRSNILNTGCNDGTHVLPRPLREKLEGLTRKPEFPFWRKQQFRASEANGIAIDMNADISAIIAKHENAGGRVTKALKREAILDAHMRGL